jgi:leucyl-tRNA synthetase
MQYNPSKIEQKWQKHWAAKKLYRTKDTAAGRENKMILVEFPYPSGNLHMGHWYAFALPDMYARYQRMLGYNVMYPMGFDAFGLPAENAAIKHDIHPEQWTRQNIATMTAQMESMGTMFDWSRVVSTIDPEYYRWTQWMFLQMYEKGLAYRAKTTVNWCPTDKTVLANEQVVDGCCERCGTAVEQKELEQWMMQITAYADRLIDDMKGLDWPRTTQIAQQNWIGRSEGARIRFGDIEVFTTRPDTIYGVTFLVVSPEMAQQWDLSDTARAYVREALAKRDLDRQEAKEKTGVDSGKRVVHPLTGKELPVWIADYVLGSYGTGAIMAVPAHDERDADFAKAYGLHMGDGMLTNEKIGKPTTTYRLRDWVLSRQRYWGVPIPIIHCPTCGYVAVPDEDLPVELPPLKDFKPADDGRSPLAKAAKWLNVPCPQCDGPAERETDTMDTFVDSSWYYLRYADPKNKRKFADKAKMAKWLPVPIYIGGAEHNTMHLLYSRFFTKVLHDLGYIDFDEPFTARRNHGIILGPDGQKMSKSKGNVVDPDAEVAQYGADTVRMYLAFMAPYEQGGPWDPKGINGVHRFLKRVWNLYQRPAISHEPSVDAERSLHLATKKIGEDLDSLSLNTCISELMKLLNVVEKTDMTDIQRGHFLLLLAPFAPHLAEELWMTALKKKISIHRQSWPAYDEALLKSDSIELPVQVNGKVRGTIVVAPDTRQDDAVFMAQADPGVARHTEGRTVAKVIYIPGKMLNIVVK